MDIINQDLISELQRQSSIKHNTPETIGRLQRTIERLSKDLYSSESHYLYELIQNADDNKYDENVIPKLHIELRSIELEGKQEYCLILNNNEKGFTEEDVRAICDVDNSTKSKDINTIGEKGIGFKSVFRITDCPYIISNKYSFNLPEKNPFDEAGLGYIIPYSFDIINISRNLNTCIILPLSKDKEPYQIAKQLKNLNENSILFLRKLRCLEIEVNLPGVKFKKRVERKDELPFRLLSISENSKTKILKFYIHEAQIKKPKKISHVNRENIRERLISIALPLFEGNNKGILYSYLPVWENTGLPFLINSDFLLTSDRENLHKEYEWNKWLRNEISSIFCSGIEHVLQNENLTIEERRFVYKSIPLESRIDFLNPVVEDIIEGLKDRPILPAFGTGTFCSSNNIKLATNNLLDIIQSSRIYPVAINEDSYPLISLDIVTEETIKVLKKIGVKELNLNNIGKHFLSDESWIKSNSTEWYVIFFDYLKSLNFKKGELQKYKLIPVEDSNSLHAAIETNLYLQLNNSPIYHSLSDEIKTLLKIAEVNQKFITSFLSQNKKERRLWIEEHLGIYEFIPKNLGIDIVNLIKEHYNNLLPHKIIQLTEQLFSLDKSLLSDKNLILIDEKQEIFDPTIENIDIVVPQNFNKDSGWQYIFIEEERSHFKVISDKYSNEVIKELVEGESVLKSYPSFRKKTLRYHSTPETESGKKLINRLKRGSANDHIWDMEAFEFVEPLSFIKNNFNEDVSNALLSLLKSHNFKPKYNWHNHISEEQLIEAGLLNKGFYFYRGQKDDAEESVISNYLKNTAWLYIENFGFQVPSSVFVNKKEISEVLGNSVPYITGIENPKLISFLGIKSELTRHSLIDYLIDAQKGKVSKETIIKIYFELDRRTHGENMFTEIDFTKKLIYLEEINKWVTPIDCIWEVPKEIETGIELNILSRNYPDSLKTFFVDKLKVTESMSIDFYLSKWKAMQSGNIEFDEEVLKVIYRRIKQDVIKKENKLVNDFLEGVQIYSHNMKEFYEPSRIYFPDDRKLKKLFKDVVPLAYLPKDDGYSAWLDFYKVLNVPILSEHIQTDVLKLTGSRMLEINKFLTPSAIKLIAAYIKTNNNDGYQELIDNNSFLKLIKTREFESDHDIQLTIYLDKIYEIKDHSPVFFSLDNSQLNFEKGIHPSDVANEIYNLCESGVENSIIQLFLIC